LNDGEPAEVADAIKDQYLPKFAGDKLPASLTGCAVALADRLDTITGIFGIGQKPSGSKDPFALRRASLGVLRIIVEKDLNLDLAECLRQAIAGHGELPAADGLEATVLAYMLERLRAWYEEDGIKAEVFMAVSAKQLSQPLDINQRVLAVNAFNQLPEAQALAAANKRVSNILAKLDDPSTIGAIDNSALADDAEKVLAAQVAAKAEAVAPLFAERQYEQALAALADLREPVDVFFDQVMVMADDEALRNNRLALLKQLRELFLEVADISLLVPAK
jgi:glycyl-tRNA synthetase beta chain